jgi:hypothetical protein
VPRGQVKEPEIILLAKMSSKILTLIMVYEIWLRPVEATLLFTLYNGPTNAIVCIKTISQMSQTKTFKITPTYFDHQMIINRELCDPG